MLSPSVARPTCTVSTGALFTSRTTTVKLLVALRGGAPLSVTFTVIRFVLGPCASVGVQVSTPVLASRRTPVGAETRPKLSVWAGRSAAARKRVVEGVRGDMAGGG